MEARAAQLQAAAVVTPAADHIAAALHETVQPLLDRIAAIEKVKDKPTRLKLMRKLLKDSPHIAAAILHDDSLAKAIAPLAVRKFVEKLAAEQGKAKTRV